MIIDTKFFGEIDIDENKIIYFKEGIPGFEDFKKYILLDIDDASSLKCLQSIDYKDICLVVTNPFEYFKDYEIELSDNEINELELKDANDTAVFNVLTIRENKITVNLVAPIVINVLNMKGKQIILTNTNYNLRQEIKCL